MTSERTLKKIMRPGRTLVLLGLLTLLFWLVGLLIPEARVYSYDAPFFAAIIIYLGRAHITTQRLLGGLDHAALRALAQAPSAPDGPQPEAAGGEPTSPPHPLAALHHDERVYVHKHLRLCLFLTDKHGRTAILLYFAATLAMMTGLFLASPLFSPDIYMRIATPLYFLGSALRGLGTLLLGLSYLGQPTRIAPLPERQEPTEQGKSVSLTRLLFLCLAGALAVYAATGLAPLWGTDEATSPFWLVIRVLVPLCLSLLVVRNTLRANKLLQLLGYPPYGELRALYLRYRKHSLRKKGPKPARLPEGSSAEADEKETAIRGGIRGSTWMMDGKNRLAALFLLIALLFHLAGPFVPAVFPDATNAAATLTTAAAVLFLAGLVDIL